jgi:hypothetical protein
MADFSDAADAALDALSGDLSLKRYRYGDRERENHDPDKLAKTAILLAGLAARRAGAGLFRKVKFQGPSE